MAGDQCHNSTVPSGHFVPVFDRVERQRKGDGKTKRRRDKVLFHGT